MELIALWVELSRSAAEFENLGEYLTKKEYERLEKIYDVYDDVAANYRSRESARLKFIEMLYHEYGMEEKSFITPSILQKANRVFSYRNKIAHDYFADAKIRGKLRIRAKDCVDILNLFYGNYYF
jgi:hypothetical protein